MRSSHFSGFAFNDFTIILQLRLNRKAYGLHCSVMLENEGSLYKAFVGEEAAFSECFKTPVEIYI